MNDFLKHINPLGKEPRYKNPAELWDKFLEYTEWVDGNPIDLPDRIGQYGSKKEVERVSKGSTKAPRPYTLYGFLAWAGITNWTMFKKAEARKKASYLRVIHAIENAVTMQQVDGAMVGLYNHNLTARLNNLAERTELSGGGGGDNAPIRVVFEGDIKPNLNPNANPNAKPGGFEDEDENGEAGEES